MLCFSHNECFLQVEATVEEDSSNQSYGNARLTLRVQSQGYSGEATAWVEREQLVRFGDELTQLNESLQGEAVLVSMGPGELNLKLRSVTSRGHVALEGSIGRYVHGDHSIYWHSVAFGFEFENTQLADAVRVSWIPRSAA